MERPFALFVALLFAIALVSTFVLCVRGYDGQHVTQVFVSPLGYVAKGVGEHFDAAVCVENAGGLHSVEFTVAYNASLLGVVEVVQGSFFPAVPKSHFMFQNATAGLIRVNVSLSGGGASLNGNGTLAVVEFKVVKYLGSCTGSPIELQGILLLDSASMSISYDEVSSVYFWKSMFPDPPSEGPLIDVYTQRGGLGLNSSGGTFHVGEIVELYSNVTYNDQPVQQKLVGFEVLDPSNNVVVIRTAITDQFGTASVQFRIPVDKSNEGIFSVISVVDVAQTTVWDTLTFRVFFELPVGGSSFAVHQTANGKAFEPSFEAVLMLAVVVGAMLVQMSARARARWKIKSSCQRNSCAGR